MRTKKGFTLLELLICISLISVVIVFLFRLINTVRNDEKAVGYIRANQASRNQAMGEIGSIIAENAVCSYSTTGSTSTHAIVTFNLCTSKTLVVEVEKMYVKITYNGVISKYPMKDLNAWYNPSFTVSEGNYYGYDYHRIVFKAEKKGMDSSPIDDLEIYWVDKNGAINTDDTKFTRIGSGTQFNIALKKLANPGVDITSRTYADENIKRIERSSTLDITPTDANKISEDTSSTPTYAWFTNGTIKIYSEANKISLRTDGSYMFNNMKGLTYVDLSMFDTSATRALVGLFQGCRDLVSVDLSTFNTKNVTDMKYMFDLDPENNNALSSITLGSNFNTSKVTSMRYMFCHINNISSLDLSMFDTKNVQDFYGFICYAPKLYEIDLGTFDLTSAQGVTDPDKIEILSASGNSFANIRTPRYIPEGKYLPLPRYYRKDEINSYTSLTASTHAAYWVYSILPRGWTTYLNDSAYINANTGVYTTAAAGSTYSSYMALERYFPVKGGEVLVTNYPIGDIIEYDNDKSFLKKATFDGTKYTIDTTVNSKAVKYIRLDVKKTNAGGHDAAWWRANLQIYQYRT